MAVSLRCPNCQATLGKDTENPIMAFCGECNGHTFYNERGYKEDTEEEAEFIRKHKNKGTRLVTLPNGRILGRSRVMNINKRNW